MIHGLLLLLGEELILFDNALIGESAGHLGQLLEQFGHEGCHVCHLQGTVAIRRSDFLM